MTTAAGPRVPLFSAPVRAGFPSPAADYLEGEMDLAGLLMPNRRSSRIVPLPHLAGRASRLGLVMDASLRPRVRDVVLARVDGETMPATLGRGEDGPVLRSPGGGLIEAFEAVCEGVATWSLRGYRDDAPVPEGTDAEFLVGARHATFMFAVAGASMRDAGIRDGDLLLVDRSLRPRHGDIVVAVVDGARSVKRLLVEGGRARLAFENVDMGELYLPLNPQSSVFGVVTWCLHRLRTPASPRRRRP